MDKFSHKKLTYIIIYIYIHSLIDSINFYRKKSESVKTQVGKALYSLLSCASSGKEYPVFSA